MAWPGNLPSNGDSWWDSWRLCDGGASNKERGLRKIKFSEYPDLWKVLSGLYGNAKENPGPEGEIMLPDFSGRFLRGMGGANTDGVLGNAQSESVGTHTHQIDSKVFEVNLGHDQQASLLYGIESARRDTIKPSETKPGPVQQGAATRPSENRPMNYPVHWVIRIK